MFRKIKIQSILLFVAFTLMSTVVFAKGHGNEVMSYFFLKKTNFTLEQAIQQLDQENKGKVISARVKMTDDLQLFEFKRIEDDGVMEVLIDPKTKKVVETSKDGIFSRYNDSDDRAAAVKSKISLLNAMEIVKGQYEGLIVKAAFSNKNLQSYYRIHTVTNQGGYMILVDADSGETFKDVRNDKQGRHGKNGSHGKDGHY